MDVNIDTTSTDIVSRFNELYNSTHKTILKYITVKCKHTTDIGDIFQDTYMEIYQVLCKRGVNYIVNGEAFALRIAKQKLSRYYTLLDRLKMFVSMNVASEDSDDFDLSEVEADTFIIEDFVVNQVMLAMAKKHIMQKPDDVKKVFYLYYEIGLTIPEIAYELAISESGVKNKLYRTIKELRNILK